jgi:nitrite reductase (NO-forming)
LSISVIHTREVNMRNVQLVVSGTWKSLMGAALTASLVMAAGNTTALAKTVKVEFTAVETTVVIDNKGTTYNAWTFNGQFPGPVVRATEGDTIEFSLTNPKTNRVAHSMDFTPGRWIFWRTTRRSNPARRAT